LGYDGKNGLIELFEGVTLSVYLYGNYVTYIKEIIPETWEKYPVDW